LVLFKQGVAFLFGVKEINLNFLRFAPMITTNENALLKEKLSMLEDEIQGLRNKELDLIQSKEDMFKLISIISHDLKNPMNTIIGLTELLEKKIQHNDLASMEEYTRHIHQSSQKIRSLLSNLLDWSITLSGKIEFRPITINLRKIIDEVVELLEETLKLKSLKMVYGCEEDIEVFVDKEMIAAVLRNIVSNSIKFSNPGSEIKIFCEKVGEQVSISISDHGIGMSENTISRLFKVGHLQSNQGLKIDTGTGFGLILCKDFLHQHQSEVIVVSEEGKGSTFKFNLPVAEQMNAFQTT
jgi:signal transduction histidine kinase